MPRAWAVRPCWGSGGWWVRVRGGPFGPAGVRGPPYSCGVTEPAGATPRLTSRTRRVDAMAELLPFADAASPLVFVRRGEGVVGVGEALRLSAPFGTFTLDAAGEAEAERLLLIAGGVGITPIISMLAALAERGYFALERKRPLPPRPTRIAVVTSPRGAAIHDFLRLASTRGSGARIRIYPVPVQGDAAPPLIGNRFTVTGGFWQPVSTRTPPGDPTIFSNGFEGTP